MNIIRLIEKKNTTRFIIGTILSFLIPSLNVKEADAALLGFQKIVDTPTNFEYDFFLDNNYNLGSTLMVGINWTLTVTEVFAVPNVLPQPAPATQAIQLSNVQHIITPHGEGINKLPDIIFPRFAPIQGGGQKQHEAHFDIGKGVYINLLNNGIPAPKNFPGAVWRLNAKLEHIPEPTTTLGLLALGTLGAASTLNRKLKSSQSTKKETTKVS